MAKAKDKAAGDSPVEENEGQATAELEAGGQQPETMSAPGRQLVGLAYEVEIPFCLLGKRTVVVDPKHMEDSTAAEREALEKYKGTVIRSHTHQPRIAYKGPVYSDA